MPDPPHHPHLRASEIESSLKNYGHRFNPAVKLRKTNMSDMVGMTGIGVVFVRLAPYADSTTIHYHLQESEWIYVISGHGTLFLLDASVPSLASAELVSERFTDVQLTPSPSDITETPLGPGDFVGYEGGLGASRFAHAFRADEGGMDVLMGSKRERVDICVYPTVGRSIVYDDADPEHTIAVDVPASRRPA